MSRHPDDKHKTLNPRQKKLLRLHEEYRFTPTREEKLEALELSGYDSQNPINYDKAINRMRGHVRSIMREYGLGEDTLFLKHKELLDAKHPKYKTPDGNVQLKALELGYQMHDIMPSKKVDIKSDRRDYIDISIETKAIAQQTAREIAEYADDEVIEAEEIDGDGDDWESPGPL